MRERLKIFLSYARPDQAKVAEIYEQLTAEGFDPWMDTRNIPPGHDWKAEIDRAVRSSGAFLSLISPHSVERGGILRGEMKAALDIRAERLDNGGFLLPVRLENCHLPSDLQAIQALDWFAPDGPERLKKALHSLDQGKKPKFDTKVLIRWLGFGAAVLLGAATAWWFAHRPGSSDIEAFLTSRNPAAINPERPQQIGLTLWKVSDSAQSEPGPCGVFRFTRQPLDQHLTVGDRLRLDVQASQEGYLYVISREIDRTGTAQPVLLYPVTMPGAVDRIRPGLSIRIPPPADDCVTLQLTHAGQSERVLILISKQPIAGLVPQLRPYPIPIDLVAKIEARATMHPREQRDNAAKTESLPSPGEQTRELGYSDPGPSIVFTFEGANPAVAAASFVLATK